MRLKHNDMLHTDWNDTIVALATPQGIGALGILRLSGPEAFGVVNGLFAGKDLLQEKSHTLHVGWLRLHGKPLDEVVVSLYRAPRSYTGEDVIEISCHGSAYIQQQVLDACTQLGARLAKPGEFTQRAFLNGKLDLTQAEAVADVIASNTAASQQAALQQMRGGFKNELSALREELIKFSALIELELDFATEDVEFADRSQFYALIEALRLATHRLVQSFKLGNVIKHGVSVAIVGKPNAGKSTLLNTLLNENRAIVSEIAGTTRDTIEEILNIDGLLFRLIDTAGIREHTVDVIEALGIEKSREKMQNADVVLYLFDVQTEQANDLLEIKNQLCAAAKPVLMVGNKADVLPGSSDGFDGYDVTLISAKNGLGIPALKTALVQMVLTDKISTEQTIVTNARHYEALRELELSLGEIKAGLDNGLTGDLLALDIRRSLQYLGEITGEITHEDQLDFIFSKFCIGK